LADRLTALTRLLLRQAEAQADATRRLSRIADDAVARLEKLVRSWEAEDEPDGPLFGGLKPASTPTPAPSPLGTPPLIGGVPLGTGATQDGLIPSTPKPARQSSGSNQRGHVETVREWWVYRSQTTQKLGAVNATTEPSALARAIEHHGPDVWVCAAGEVIQQAGDVIQQPSPAIQEGPPAIQPAWDATCDFLVTLADGQQVACTWHPDQSTASSGGPGILEMRGACISSTGLRRQPVIPAHRNEPLPEVARRRAQEAADCEAKHLAETKPKDIDWSKARKEDLASGAARPRKKRRPAKGEASEKPAPVPAEEGGGR
jgi:hypothetical protein